MSRVFILGIDGGEWRVVDYLISKRQLPNIASLIEGGVRRPLLSTFPPLTPAAWVSFYTGTNPGRHGVIDFLARKEGSYALAPVHRAMAAGRTLWQAAGEAGKKSLIVNIPVTYPPDRLDGWMISGMDTPGPQNPYAYPPELKEEVLRLFPAYTPDVHISRRRLKAGRDLPSWYLGEVLRLEETRMSLVEHLAASRPWDLAVAVLTAADRLQHVFWGKVEGAMAAGALPSPDDPAGSVFEAYRAADRFIPRIMKLIGENGQVMIISDHGFGPLDKDINLNLLLNRMGFLAFKEPPAVARLRGRVSRRLKETVPGPMRDLLWKMLPPPKTKRLEGLDFLEQVIDWPNTRAYAVGYLGGIFLNLRGREPMGTVAPEDYDRTVDNLAAALAAFPDPDDGRPLVTEVRRRGEIYRGPRTGSLPDLVLTLKDHRGTARPSFSGPGDRLFSRPQEEFGALSHTGSHRPEGLFIGAGPSFAGASVPPSPSIMDIHPTALDLLGIGIPAELDGRSLLRPAAAVSSPDTGKNDRPFHAEKPRPALSPEEERKILDNLKDLGYF